MHNMQLAKLRLNYSAFLSPLETLRSEDGTRKNLEISHFISSVLYRSELDEGELMVDAAD